MREWIFEAKFLIILALFVAFFFWKWIVEFRHWLSEVNEALNVYGRYDG
jgi:hypothetical protein